MLSRSPTSRTQDARWGFTLIELILALALSGVLLTLLGATLHLGISRAMGSREKVEQARLVEGVLRLVTSDIESTVIYNPQDTSTAMSLAESSAAFDVDSIDEITAGGGEVGSSGAAAGGLADAQLGTISLRRLLGVYGTLNELQVDVFREHPKYEVDAMGNLAPPTTTSGITTVRYAVGEGVASLGTSATLDGRSSGTGLVRQEVSRDLLNWAEQQGADAGLLGQAVLVAPEVSRVEFRYFDGLNALETWDSQLLGGQLPRAIEVRMWFVQEGESAADGPRREVETKPYVLTVALPTSWNFDEELLPADGSSTTETIDTSSAAGGAR